MRPRVGIVRERGARGRVDDRVVVLVVETCQALWRISAGTCATRPPVAPDDAAGVAEERRRERRGARRDGCRTREGDARRRARQMPRQRRRERDAGGGRVAARRGHARRHHHAASGLEARARRRKTGFIATADIVDANSTSSSRESSASTVWPTRPAFVASLSIRRSPPRRIRGAPSGRPSAFRTESVTKHSVHMTE